MVLRHISWLFFVESPVLVNLLLNVHFEDFAAGWKMDLCILRTYINDNA